MFKFLLLTKAALMPRKGRDDHGQNGFGDAHSREEWDAFDRALHRGFNPLKTVPLLRVYAK